MPTLTKAIVLAATLFLSMSLNAATNVNLHAIVNLYGLQKVERAKLDQAKALFTYDQEKILADVGEVSTNTNGEIIWNVVAENDAIVTVNIKSNIAQYVFDGNPFVKTINSPQISLNEIRLFNIARLGAEKFAVEADRIEKLEKKFTCLGDKYSASVLISLSCWGKHPNTLIAASSQAIDIIDRLDAIVPMNSTIALQALNLRTKVGLFCSQANLKFQGILDGIPEAVREQSNSLYACADGLGQELTDFTHSDLRSYLQTHLGVVSDDIKRELLRIWFYSYVKEFKDFSPEVIASKINEKGYQSEWQKYLDHIRTSVSAIDFFPITDCSRQQIEIVKKSLAI
jgi:hypothetical protein